ncbi:hypothetical protein ACFSTC_03345 [Nonomuraea ferruginea]
MLRRHGGDMRAVDGLLHGLDLRRAEIADPARFQRLLDRLAERGDGRLRGAVGPDLPGGGERSRTAPRRWPEESAGRTRGVRGGRRPVAEAGPRGRGRRADRPARPARRPAGAAAGPGALRAGAPGPDKR